MNTKSKPNATQKAIGDFAPNMIAVGLVTTLAAVTPDLTAAGDQGTGHAALEVSTPESRVSLPGPAEYFTGTVAVEMLFQPNGTRNASAATVTFSPNARTTWHSHPAGQTLVVTSGTGWVQIWGRERQAMKEGDVVWIPANTKHWHGATDTAAMTHLAIQEQHDGDVVEWLEPVTDEQYMGSGSSK